MNRGNLPTYSETMKPGGFERELHERFFSLRGPPAFERRVTWTYPTEKRSNAVLIRKFVEHYESWSYHKHPQHFACVQGLLPAIRPNR